MSTARSVTNGGCETCLPVPLTPRTAAVLGYSLSLLANEVYDQIYRSGHSCGWVAGLLGTLQDVLFQDKDYEHFLRAPRPLPHGEAELWFEAFGKVRPRERHRRFRR